MNEESNFYKEARRRKYVVVNGKEYRRQVVDKANSLFNQYKKKSVDVAGTLRDEDYDNHYLWEGVIDFLQQEILTKNK